MEAKIEKITELFKLLSVKNRMSDDLFHLFGQVWYQSPIISPAIRDTGRSFRFGVDSFSLPLPHCG